MKTKTKIALGFMALTLAACSNSEIAELSAPVDGAQTIVIKVSDARSRAGRELSSQKAEQSVENVKIVLTDDQGNVVWTKLLNAWNSDDASISLQSVSTATGRQAEIEVPKDEFRMLDGSNYHIYSYAYSNGSDYDLTPITSLEAGKVLTSDIALAIKAGVVGEEIFAGDCSVIGNMGGVRAELVLNRQVAGTYAYMTRIPYVADARGNVGRYLILTASNPQSQLVLGSFDNADASADYQGHYVVNGTAPATESVIYTIDLMDWFANLVPAKDADGRSTGLIDASGDNWKGDVTRYKRGSVYAGSFVIPFAKADAATLQLKLCYSSDPSTAMRVWNVMLPSTAAQLSQYDLTQWTDGAWTATKVADTQVVYSVLRNHLYAIGTKLSDKLPSVDPNNPDAPGDPDAPDTPDDTPEPINNKQELTIIVSHNWDAIYNMGVE